MTLLTLPPSAGPQVVKRVLHTRWRALIITFFVVLLTSALAVTLIPRQYTASNTVQITPLGVETAAPSRSGSVDMTTEVELVRSAKTASNALEHLGSGWVLEDLMENVSVSADPLGAVLTISWTDTNPDRARAASAALAKAYLQVRAELARLRAQALRESLDTQIEKHQEELKNITDSSPSAQGQRDAIFSAITTLVSRRATLENYNAPAGQIITPDTAVPLIIGPSRVKIIAASLLSGVFLGLLVVLLREKTDPRIRDAAQLAEIVAAPVWGPDLTGEGAVRWYGAARMAVLAGKEHGRAALIIDSTEAEAELLMSAVADANDDQGNGEDLLVIDLHAPREKVLRSLAFVGHVSIAPGIHMPRAEVRQLVDQIDSSGCHLIGAFILPPKYYADGKDMMGVTSAAAGRDSSAGEKSGRAAEADYTLNVPADTSKEGRRTLSAEEYAQLPDPQLVFERADDEGVGGPEAHHEYVLGADTESARSEVNAKAGDAGDSGDAPSAAVLETGASDNAAGDAAQDWRSRESHRPSQTDLIIGEDRAPTVAIIPKGTAPGRISHPGSTQPSSNNA
ncbi:hypothetical protein [Schaalia sp. Marseille-Q2122]|uniref:hypothetical protein n=1 Tax=Schaalia sp. Marseille-Q2122 TaxID=2736604 RepID=UPI00158E6724|nr:hypothetical protein [Schaalia sp. Marseille-Q2122]